MIKIILFTIGILAIIESLSILSLTKSSKKYFIKLIKSNKIKNIAIAELIIAIILIILGFII